MLDKAFLWGCRAKIDRGFVLEKIGVCEDIELLELKVLADPPNDGVATGKGENREIVGAKGRSMWVFSNMTLLRTEKQNISKIIASSTYLEEAGARVFKSSVNKDAFRAQALWIDAAKVVSMTFIAASLFGCSFVTIILRTGA